VPKSEDFTGIALRALPKPARRAINHWRKLRDADYVVVSFPKSGRTWLLVMLSMLYQRIYALGDDELLGFANFHKRDSRIPKIYFTHDVSYKAAPEKLRRDKSEYEHLRVLLLARDPRDVIVSLYFDRKHRARDLDDVPIFDFVMAERGGLATVIEYCNIWWEALPRMRKSMVLTYEDMHAAPVESLARVAGFMGLQAHGEILESVVLSASFSRMRELESKDHFDRSCLRPASTDEEQSFKVRRGKVGGWLDYFSDEEAERIDALVAQRLNPAYGYSGVGRGTQSRPGRDAALEIDRAQPRRQPPAARFS